MFLSSERNVFEWMHICFSDEESLNHFSLFLRFHDTLAIWKPDSLLDKYPQCDLQNKIKDYSILFSFQSI